MGLLHKSFDASKLTFEMQYSSSAGDFDPTLPNGENFDKQSIFRFDGNTGIYYKYNDETKKARPFGGFSIYHVTQPNESFTSYKNRLPMHFIGNAGTDIQVNEKLMLTPKVLFMYQQKAHELNLGLNGEYDLGQSDLEILGGVYYRTSDALIAEIGIRQEHHTLRISYDFNTSYLNKFTAGRGGIEVSLILTGFKGKPLFTMSRFGGGDNPHR
jgi:type IX secretion system PorP/SprF family membrane protein